jgi:Hint domain
VAFNIELTSATTVDTVVDYAAIPGVGIPNGKVYLDASDFGGTLPFGSATIPAGFTSTAISIDVPNSAIGSATDEWLMLSIDPPAGNAIFDPTAQIDILNGTTVAGTLASPAIELLPSTATEPTEFQPELTQVASAYIISLGNVVMGASASPLEFAVANNASMPGDDLQGTITSSTGDGFYEYGTALPATIAAGDAWQGLEFVPATDRLGSNNQTITLESTDSNATGYLGTLSALTLTLNDNVIAPALGILNTGSVIFPNVRMGTTETHTLSVSNTAAAGAAGLDTSLLVAGNVDATGSVALLAPGATDTTSLAVGIDTTTIGTHDGTVTVDFFSDLGDGSQVATTTTGTVTVSGTVYREASASIATINTIVHVHEPGTITVGVTNAAAADGFSENLIASLSGASGPLAVASGGPTGDIAPGDTSGVSVSFSTAQAGTAAGSIIVGLVSDGGTGAGSVDGLGTIALSSETIGVNATIDNYATAQIVALGDAPLNGSGQNYTLDFGRVNVNSAPVTDELGVENAASSVADLLEGSFVAGSDSEIALNGFSNFSNLSAGSIASGMSVTLDTGTVGTFSQTITLDPTGYNSGGFIETLDPETLTLTGTVVACFAAGTLIETTDGPVPVEDLSEGQELRTVLGGPGRIVWVGKRTVVCARQPNAETVWPIRITRGAFGKGRPSRDLYLSPDHAVYVDGILIPAKLLIDGRTIRQVRLKSVTYYHVELQDHDVIFANELPAESYLDTGDRMKFANGGPVATLHPDFSARTWEMAGCAPMVLTGPRLAAVRERLNARNCRSGRVPRRAIG